jgi:PAS domain S-box-containing protein
MTEVLERPGREGLRKRAWQFYLLCGGILGLAYFLGPPQVRAASWIYNGVSWSAVAMIMVGVRMNRPQERVAWGVMAFGLALFASGDLITYNTQFFLHASSAEAPFPSVGDALYLLFYPVIIFGVLILVRRRSPGRDRAALIDSLIITIGIGVLSWVYLMAPYAHDPTLTLAQKLVSVAYPLGDLLLLGVLVRLAVGGGRRPPAFYLLLVSMICLLVTDNAYGIIRVAFTYNGQGSILDAGWALFYLFWAAAALHPSMFTLGQESKDDRERVTTQKRLVILASASLTAPTVLAVQAIRGKDSDALIVAAASAVLFVLVLIRLRGLMVDIAEYRRTESLLRETEAKYRSLVEGTPAIVYIAEFPKEGHWRYVSPQIESILGFSAEEWIEAPGLWQERLHPVDRDRVLREQNRDVRGGQRMLFEYRMVARDGEVVWIRDDAEVVEESGEMMLLQGVMYDFSEQKRAESKLREALDREREASQHLRKLDAMKNSFLQAVSHDLRTPLTSILAGALTIENDQLDLSSEERKDLAHRLAGNARKLNKMLSDLLDLDRLSRGILTPNRKPTDLAELVQRVVGECDLQGREVQIEAEDLTAEVDPAQVERIVENLVTNAVRYTPPGTPVWVKVASHERGALITVEDAGPGVPTELRKAIFEPFRQGQEVVQHSPGVGIGLSLVARFAALHSGRAWVDDRPGGGASFKVYLPRETPVRAIAV